MLWIEDIVLIPSFLTNSKVDMASFVDFRKVIVKSAFLAFSHARNEGESKGGVESAGLKH